MICIRTSWNTMSTIEVIGGHVYFMEYIWTRTHVGPQWLLWANPMPQAKDRWTYLSHTSRFADIRELEIYLTNVFGIKTDLVGSASAWK